MDAMRRLRNAVTGIPFTSWREAHKHIDDAQRPHAERKAAIEKTYHEWHQAENQRVGASVSTTPPTSIEAAYVQAEQRERDALRGEWARLADGIADTRATAHVSPLDAAIDEVLAAAPALASFDEQRRALAARCGIWMPKPVPTDGLVQALREFRARIQLLPEQQRGIPTRPAHEPASSNPIPTMPEPEQIEVM